MMAPPMKAYVYVSLKKSVLDPQGKTIQGALKKMGYKGLESVRQGKYFELTLDGGLTREQAQAEVERIAREVLTNPVIEEFRFSLADKFSEAFSMCGIVGYVGKKRVVPIILEGLRRLEYRGYDSAGIAVAGNGEGLQIRRAEGKLRNLEEVIRQRPLDGSYGIGHTRWATHGRPTEENAHPHRDCTGKIVVVHNGIVENYVVLKKKLIEEGHKFSTETDTEVIAHLVEKHMADAAAGNGERVSLEDA